MSPSCEPNPKAKCLHKWTLELIPMHLLPEMNRWHFKNNLCMQFTVRIKPHHHFQRWQRDSSVWVFLGWQTPALIWAWMMSSNHYMMIKSLPPPHSHQCYELNIHSHTLSCFSCTWWEPKMSSDKRKHAFRRKKNISTFCKYQSIKRLNMKQD